MKARRYQITPPEKSVDHKEGNRILTQSAGASASYETEIASFVNSVQIDRIRLVLDAAMGAITVNSVAATGFINLWRAGQQLSNDGAFGAYTFNAVANTLAKLTNSDLVPGNSQLNNLLGGYTFVGMITGAVVATNTTMTVLGLGTNALTTLESTAILNGGNFSMTLEPGTANAETVTVTAFNTGTGVTTNSAFVNSHAAGALVVVRGSAIFQGTQAGAMTANTTTGGTLTAIAPSLLTANVLVGSQLTIEPGTSNAETFPIGAFNTGTGVYTIAANYNSGKCLLAHSAGASVAVLNPSSVREVNAGDILTFKWVQSPTTGLALPACKVDVDYSFSGYRY